MGESNGIDSLLGGWAMPKVYSGDMRQSVIAEVESGASRRAAAEEFAISASTAIIWVKCFRETSRCAAKPRGGSIRSLQSARCISHL
jgi:transposase